MVSITRVKSLGNWLTNLAQSMAEALLPQDCLVCGRPQVHDHNRVLVSETSLRSPQLLCPECRADLPLLSDPACPVCALPTPAGQVCGPCLSKPPAFDASFALYAYAFPVDRLIQALKYQHRLALAEWLGAELARVMGILLEQDDLKPPDVILPMPLHPDRLRQRGFDQAVELARPLALALNRPLALDLVQRRANAVPQASLPWKERRKNIRGAFLCAQDVSGRHIWVVDDVMTTGATLGELAHVLKSRGAAQVTNVVVARTLHHG